MIRPIKIGLIAEGQTELGASSPFISPQDGGKVIPREKEGTLHTLIRRDFLDYGNSSHDVDGSAVVSKFSDRRPLLGASEPHRSLIFGVMGADDGKHRKIPSGSFPQFIPRETPEKSADWDSPVVLIRRFI